jgi:uncharacterized protein YqgV (UPF0045/DUF77 family)
LRRAEELRNKLAHSNERLVGGRDWDQVLGVVQAAERAVARFDAELALLVGADRRAELALIVAPGEGARHAG